MLEIWNRNQIQVGVISTVFKQFYCFLNICECSISLDILYSRSVKKKSGDIFGRWKERTLVLYADRLEYREELEKRGVTLREMQYFVAVFC